MPEILQKLRGGDLRSTGRANDVVREIKENPSLFHSVVKGLTASDPVIKMRSADVIEKVTRTSPTLLSGYTRQILSLLAAEKQQEVCWHMAQIAPRLHCNTSEERRLVTLLKSCLLHRSKIVQVSAMEALVELAEKNVASKADVADVIKKQMTKGSPAVKVRGRKLMQRLEKIPDNKA